MCLLWQPLLCLLFLKVWAGVTYQVGPALAGLLCLVLIIEIC